MMNNEKIRTIHWVKPMFKEKRFGFEVTMYAFNR